MTTPAPDHKRYFIEKLGISERLMERCLGEALSAGGDYADLYFESVTSTSLGIDESLVKSASQGISVGCGIRVALAASAPAMPTPTISPATACCRPPAPPP